MASDGKGQRKLHAPFCSRCRDCGWVFEWHRAGGKMVDPARAPCPKNCPAGQKWKSEQVK